MKILIIFKNPFAIFKSLFNERLSLSKREKIIAATVIVSIGILFGTRVASFIFLKERLILSIGLLTYFFTIWALWEGMTRVKAFTLLVLPVFFTMSVASFYFLIPPELRPNRFIWTGGFALSFYWLLLSQNVFNVASVRTIPLYRVASTTSFIYTVFTAFILYNVSYALNSDFALNGIAVFLISFILALPIFWSLEMEHIRFSDLLYTSVISLVAGETAMALSFWPLAPTIWSLALSTVFYISLAIMIDNLKERSNKRQFTEYLVFGLIVFIVSIFTTTWGG